MNWRIKAITQKLLSLTKFGDKLNHIPPTLNKKYHYNVVWYQTHECIRKFSYFEIDLCKNKIVLEIGTGYSLTSVIVLALLGFKKVITVDITRDITFSDLKKQINYLNEDKNLKLICSKSIFTESKIKNMIFKLQKIESLESFFKFLNIIYIAPYEFKDIIKHSKKFDYITSQVVLEHMSPDLLNELFKFTKETLNKGLFSVHTINFIDHFTNSGFFQDKSISEFNFLRYSNKFWKNWAGNSIAYTNRLSYMYYLNLCKKYNLNIVNFIGENYKERIELDIKLIHHDVLRKYDFNIDPKDLIRYQRGTLIISNN